MPHETWSETLAAFAGNSSANTAVRRNTHTGRPLGSDSFLSKLEILLDRRLRPLLIGRQIGW